MTDDQLPILGQPPVRVEQVEELVVDAAPDVAYPDRPWVMIGGVVGAVALGGIVFATLISGQKAREVGGIVPTRSGTNDTGLGAPVPQAPELFAQTQPAPFVAGPAVLTPDPGSIAQSEGPPSFSGSPPPPPPPPTPPPPPPSPPPAPVVEYRDRPFPPSPTPPIAPIAVRPAADMSQRMRSPALIIDLSIVATPSVEGSSAVPSPGVGGDNDAFAARVAASDTGAIRAGALRNPRAVVPQGAMISAVLETAINSDLPGFVRAIVSRDVTSFDGSRVLIPRGSRLVGQYKSEVAIGQSRAFVIWTRLMRPDGVSVQLASPGTDTLGRAGLNGRVDRHYLQRFGPGLLTTAITAALSGSNRSNQLVIGTAQSAGAPTTGEAIKPTVTVAQGTAIQVFVARDLDFSNINRPAGSGAP